MGMPIKSIIDLTTQRPNSVNSILLCTQYETSDKDYLGFCKIMADIEDPKEYVSPNLDNDENEKTCILHPVISRQRVPSPDDKPQESYAYMIYKALECSQDGKLTLSDIYNWIEETYVFYRTADPVWKNSIRHNLSLNPIFKKIPRPECSKGKGGYWAIDYENQKNGKPLRKKKMLSVPEIPSVDRLPIGRGLGSLIF